MFCCILPNNNPRSVQVLQPSHQVTRSDRQAAGITNTKAADQRIARARMTARRQFKPVTQRGSSQPVQLAKTHARKWRSQPPVIQRKQSPIVRAAFFKAIRASMPGQMWNMARLTLRFSSASVMRVTWPCDILSRFGEDGYKGAPNSLQSGS